MEIQQTDQFRKWLRRLRDRDAKARIIARIRQCGLAGRPVGDMHPVGNGVNELRFFFGPGYRVYFAQKGDRIMLLLAGGDKTGQDRAIKEAQEMLESLIKEGAMVNIGEFDASEYIEGEDDAIAYLNAAAETGDPALLQAAIGDIAKARGMGQIAKEAGVGRESLYKSLDREGNPSFRTIVRVVNALGGRLVIEPTPATV